MTLEDIEKMIRQVVERLKNDPERARQVDAEVDTMMLENPDFFERTAGRTFSQLTRDEIKEMLSIVEAHRARNKSAN